MHERAPKSAWQSGSPDSLWGLDHPVASFQLSVAMSHRAQTEEKRESLSEAFSHLLEECRMVLPGIQALFGFQLIAVFNQAFWTQLQSAEQMLHFLCIGLVGLSIALVMTPAAYHRQAEPLSVSQKILTLSSRVLFWSMVSLMVALAGEFYIIGELVLGSRRGSAAISLALLAVFSALWFGLPRLPWLGELFGAARRGSRAPKPGWKVTKGAQERSAE